MLSLIGACQTACGILNTFEIPRTGNRPSPLTTAQGGHFYAGIHTLLSAPRIRQKTVKPT